MTYWVYFIGTSNGAWIQAPTMKQAKEIFASMEGVNSLSYIKASKERKQ